MANKVITEIKKIDLIPYESDEITSIDGKNIIDFQIKESNERTRVYISSLIQQEILNKLYDIKIPIKYFKIYVETTNLNNYSTDETYIFLSNATVKKYHIDGFQGEFSNKYMIETF